MNNMHVTFPGESYVYPISVKDGKSLLSFVESLETQAQTRNEFVDQYTDSETSSIHILAAMLNKELFDFTIQIIKSPHKFRFSRGYTVALNTFGNLSIALDLTALASIYELELFRYLDSNITTSRISEQERISVLSYFLYFPKNGELTERRSP